MLRLQKLQPKLKFVNGNWSNCISCDGFYSIFMENVFRDCIDVDIYSLNVENSTWTKLACMETLISISDWRGLKWTKGGIVMYGRSGYVALYAVPDFKLKCAIHLHIPVSALGCTVCKETGGVQVVVGRKDLYTTELEEDFVLKKLAHFSVSVDGVVVSKNGVYMLVYDHLGKLCMFSDSEDGWKEIWKFEIDSVVCVTDAAFSESSDKIAISMLNGSVHVFCKQMDPSKDEVWMVDEQYAALRNVSVLVDGSKMQGTLVSWHENSRLTIAGRHGGFDVLEVDRNGKVLFDHHCDQKAMIIGLANSDIGSVICDSLGNVWHLIVGDVNDNMSSSVLCHDPNGIVRLKNKRLHIQFSNGVEKVLYNSDIQYVPHPTFATSYADASMDDAWHYSKVLLIASGVIIVQPLTLYWYVSTNEQSMQVNQIHAMPQIILSSCLFGIVNQFALVTELGLLVVLKCTDSEILIVYSGCLVSETTQPAPICQVKMLSLSSGQLSVQYHSTSVKYHSLLDQNFKLHTTTSSLAK